MHPTATFQQVGSLYVWISVLETQRNNRLELHIPYIKIRSKGKTSNMFPFKWFCRVVGTELGLMGNPDHDEIDIEILYQNFDVNLNEGSSEIISTTQSETE